MADLALAEKQCCHEAATQSAMSVESSLANKRCHHKVAARAAELAELVLAKKQRPHKTTVQGKALAHDTCKQHCRESAECTAVSAKLALAAERTAVSAELALPKPAWLRTNGTRKNLPQNNAGQTTSALWRQ